MGKGKGGRGGVLALLHPGAILVAFSSIRWGVLFGFFRCLVARCAFPLQIANKQTSCTDSAPIDLGLSSSWVANRRLHPSYISERFYFLKERLLQLKRPFLWNYFFNIFVWRLLTPYAVWTPSLTERYKLRLRRRHLRRSRLIPHFKPQTPAFIRQLRARLRFS